MRQKNQVKCLAVVLVLVLAGAVQAEKPVVEWIRQLGTAGWDYGKGVSVDGSGNAYVTGYTCGSLDGNISEGDRDIFLVKYDANGNKLWTRQLGTASRDEGHDISVDDSGNIYITGRTEGELDGNTSTGNWDMFLAKYTTNGNKLWTQQLGTPGYDGGHGVSVDNCGNAYVTGSTESGLDGNISAGYSDMFLTKYDTDGTKQWTRQLGSDRKDYGSDVSVDGNGNSYVTGITWGGLDGNTIAGIYDDMFLTKYDTNGVKLWTRQLGTDNSESGKGVSVDDCGNAYVTGNTVCGLDGNIATGGWDIFLTKYDTDGVKLWTEQLGSAYLDSVYDVSVDGSGSAYVTGYTGGGLDDNTNAGNYDMFLVKISTIPEPGIVVMLVGVGLVRLLFRRRGCV